MPALSAWKTQNRPAAIRRASARRRFVALDCSGGHHGSAPIRRASARRRFVEPSRYRVVVLTSSTRPGRHSLRLTNVGRWSAARRPPGRNRPSGQPSRRARARAGRVRAIASHMEPAAKRHDTLELPYARREGEAREVGGTIRRSMASLGEVAGRGRSAAFAL